jgi:hypothetical protein
MLVFTAHVADPTSRCCPSRKAVDRVEPFLIRPAEIINQRLPEVIAIRERLPGDCCDPRVDSFDASVKLSIATFSFEFVAEFCFEQAINPVRLGPALALHFDQL